MSQVKALPTYLIACTTLKLCLADVETQSPLSHSILAFPIWFLRGDDDEQCLDVVPTKVRTYVSRPKR